MNKIKNVSLHLWDLMFLVRWGVVTIIDGRDGISRTIADSEPTEVEELSLREATLDVYDDFPLPVFTQNLRDVTAILSCVNLTKLYLDGASMNFEFISTIPDNFPNLRHLSLKAITDPDDGTSISTLVSSRLETLDVACWCDLQDEVVLQLVSGCRSLRSMVVSHCTALSITATEAASSRTPPAPFVFLECPQCTPRCLPPNHKCIKCIQNQIESDAELALQLGGY